jgi:hydroxyethylthiazole kinase-like sugar kinase family protein
VVQCITNIVTVNDCANALLAIGASPTMAHHPLEREDFAKICDALVCNMGATESLDAMGKAVIEAGRRGHPVVVDPVGCAGSPFRREQCIHLMRTASLSCIRGNAAELTARMAAYKPLMAEALPLSLEEIFIYELGGEDYAVKDIIL